MNKLNKSIKNNAYQVFHLNVFTQKIFSGNSATVVWVSNELSDKKMQLLAREFNTSESIFVRMLNDELFLRFFTPTQEVFSCGHGTIGAAYVAKKMQNMFTSTLVLNTVTRRIIVQSIKTNIKEYQKYKFEVPVPILEACINLPKNIIASLNAIKTTDKVNEVEILAAYIVNTGTDKNRLLLRCKNKEQLLSLSPNFSQLLVELEKLNFFSVFIFSTDNQTCTKISGRMFAPNIGINEDPVNGNSSIALSCVIYNICKNNGVDCPEKYEVYQGEAVNRAGKTTIHLHYDSHSILYVELSGAVIELYNYNLQKPQLKMTIT